MRDPVVLVFVFIIGFAFGGIARVVYLKVAGIECVPISMVRE